MLSDNRSLPGSLRNRKKGYPPEDLHGKSRIRGRYLNLTSYPAIASNEPRIIPLNRSPICNATNCPPMKYLTENNEGELNIAVPLMRSSCMIPQIMAEFSEKYPNVNVSIWEEAYSIQEKLLLNDQLDFGIFNETREHPKLEYELLKREEILLVMPPDHPLASSGYQSPSYRYPRIDLSTLASEPFILHFPEQTTGKLVLEALDRAGVQPRVPVRSRNTETCVKLCMQGIGMCFTPETYMQNMEFSRKPVCFSVGEKGIFTTLSIAFRRGTYLPKYARDFIEIARNK